MGLARTKIPKAFFHCNKIIAKMLKKRKQQYDSDKQQKMAKSKKKTK